MNPPNPCFRLRPTLFEPPVHNPCTLHFSLLTSEAVGKKGFLSPAVGMTVERLSVFAELVLTIIYHCQRKGVEIERNGEIYLLRMKTHPKSGNPFILDSSDTK